MAREEKSRSKSHASRVFNKINQREGGYSLYQEATATATVTEEIESRYEIYDTIRLDTYIISSNVIYHFRDRDHSNDSPKSQLTLIRR